MTRLATDIANLQVGTPLHAGDLTVYPLIRPATMPPTWITLGEALAKGLAGITEVSEGGSVPTLVFRNGGTRFVSRPPDALGRYFENLDSVVWADTRPDGKRVHRRNNP